MSSSLSSVQQVLQHSTHIHPLKKIHVYSGFTCDGCKTFGSGKAYRCFPCDYDLHEYCATGPPTLRSFLLHPQHELKLVVNPPGHVCDFCHELVEGFYYRCEACDFDAHPLCTQMPQHVSYILHPAHALKLSQGGTGSTCLLCEGDILSWRYKCVPCMVDVHVECVTNLTVEEVARLKQMLTSDDNCEGKNNSSHTKGSSKTKTVFKNLMHLTAHAVYHIVTNM